MEKQYGFLSQVATELFQWAVTLHIFDWMRQILLTLDTIGILCLVNKPHKALIITKVKKL